MKYLYGFLFFLVVCILLFVIVPSPVDSVSYHPKTPPALTGALTPNDDLKQAEILAKGLVYGPEDIDVDDKGHIYGGTQDGKIIRLTKDGTVETFAQTLGRPLGLHFDRHGNLIVCDAWKGLLSIDPQGNITTLSTEAEGVPFFLTNDLDIDSQGIIYFTDASSRFHRPEYKLDLLEAKPHGRLLSYNPDTKETKVLLRDLYFANGVALSQNEDFVVVNETYRYRVVRYWLKGEKAGTHEIFIDNLPGFPDGISANRRGTFWLAIPAPRKALVDNLHPKPFLKNLLAKLPEFLLPKPQSYGLVLALNEQGGIVRSLHDADGTHVKEITSVQEHDGYLYLGNLSQDWVGRLRL
ncbi:MAG: SMP-30/gluconolactonase/LRE family protein [Gammaproteobacteria bacterium]|nr:SMP-30/gluconolactonase/LRE family protein [Gammaproteobacteria bacterium]NNJ83769.1 SMP-30/gluconolactonase/LRE family protein [Gammaproteobacteria bacterium]